VPQYSIEPKKAWKLDEVMMIFQKQTAELSNENSAVS
jgi:hypothetical protein